MEALDLTVTADSKRTAGDKHQKNVISTLPQTHSTSESQMNFFASRWSSPSFDSSILEKHSQEDLVSTLSNKSLVSMIDNSLPCLSPGVFNRSAGNHPELFFRCNICDKISSSLSSVTEHFLQDHKDYVGDSHLVPASTCLNGYMASSPHSDSNDHMTPTVLEFHKLQSSSDLPCPLNDYFPKRKLKLLPPMKCRFCDKNFYCRFYLQRHMRSHTGEKICHCSTCGKGFSELRNLRNHMTRKHCNYNSSCFSSLRNQQQDCKEVKFKVCSTMCADSSTDSVNDLPAPSSLNIPVIRDRRTLNAKLRRKFQLEKESEMEVNSEDNVGETPCKCNHSDITTDSSDAMSYCGKEQAEHNVYLCEYCDYEAKTSPQLKVHLMRHRGDKSFSCRICNYSCVTRSDLNRHCKSRAHGIRMALQKQDAVGGLSENRACDTSSV